MSQARSSLRAPCPHIPSMTALFSSPPKKESTPGSRDAICSALDTRPITLRNCPNEIVAGVFNNSLKPVLTQGICSSQRGFIPGRRFINNIVDIESAGILHSLLAGPCASLGLAGLLLSPAVAGCLSWCALALSSRRCACVCSPWLDLALRLPWLQLACSLVSSGARPCEACLDFAL